MAFAEKELLRCEQCGATLERGVSSLGCVNCLLRAAFDEAGSENRRFQHYELCLRGDETLDELGRGAMGITYRAQDVNLGSSIALKVISARYSNQPEVRERFLREARAAAQLRHPNVASVFHFGETATGQCFYAMELVEGETLEAQVRRDGPLPAPVALEVAIQIARALMAGEAHGLVHRDLKPSNLMVVANDSSDMDAMIVKVIDFGLAKTVVATPDTSDQAHSSFSGTPDFASPEQLSAGEVPLDIRSDIYSLGATLWYLLCGRAPFAGRAPGEVPEHALPLEQLAGARVPAPVVAVLRSMLASSPAARPQSARELLTALRRCRDALEATPRRRRLLQLAALGIAVGVLAVGLTSYLSRRAHAPSANAMSEKSIAVLPFKNLSTDPENAFLADGVQDEVLTNLAKLTDLDVISRTSTAHYKTGADRNMHDIARELGVAYVVEGSAQRVGDRIRVSAQLINARTDSHLWAEHYDRQVADVFAIQSEIAKAIADQLQAKLSPNEKKAIEQPPTTDLAAFDLYSRAKSVLLTANFSVTQEPDQRKAIELLDEAVKRDPSFFDAYCQLSSAHEYLYANGLDHTPARLALAEAALQAATRLRPDAAETHLARAQYLYYGRRNYAGALAELEIARRALPNDPRLFELTGYILRRRGQQEEGLQNLERAVELDPRNFVTLQEIAASYQQLGRYADAIAVLDRALAIVPDNVETRAAREQYYVCWKADTRPLRQTIDAILAQGPGAIASAADIWFFCALAERDPAAAERALVALGDNACWGEFPIVLSRSFGEGLLARMSKDEARARTAFEAARAQQEKIVQAQPDYGPTLCVLGLIDSALGRKDLALDEGRRAIALTPLKKDGTNGSFVLQYFAITAAWAGDKELALQQLEAGLRAPTASLMLSYGALKLFPFWDPLRGDPRFEKIVASLAPK